MARAGLSTYCPACEPTATGGRGIPDSFARVVLYGIATLGIYFLYYGYEAFREMDVRAGRRHRGRLYIVGLAVYFAMLVAFFLASEAGTWMETPAAHLAWTAGAVVSVVPWAAYFWLEAVPLRKDLPGRTIHPAVLPALLVFQASLATVTTALVTDLAIIGLEATTWYFLHASINQWWDQRTGGARPVDAVPA